MPSPMTTCPALSFNIVGGIDDTSGTDTATYLYVFLARSSCAPLPVRWWKNQLRGRVHRRAPWVWRVRAQAHTVTPSLTRSINATRNRRLRDCMCIPQLLCGTFAGQQLDRRI